MRSSSKRPRNYSAGGPRLRIEKDRSERKDRMSITVDLNSDLCEAAGVSAALFVEPIPEA